jgi:glycosyltransferase involved in cell wall biosynthesis
LPAFKAGGPIRSIVNFVEMFKDDFDIYVFTSDRDLGDTQAFQNIETDVWTDQDRFKIMYASHKNLNHASIKKLIQTINPDWLYLNSMFSAFTIYALLVLLRSRKIVLAPRGMLRNSALAIKPIRKYLYLSLLKMLNVDQYIRLHATSSEEANSIKQIFPNAQTISVVPNLPPKINQELSSREKNQGELNMIFIGRMHPIKNLLYLLSCLENVYGNCSLKIIATKEDEIYWKECQDKISKLKTISIETMINMPHHEIKEQLEQSELFVLPTKGENFGHAILEALSVGCPVLISDQTPWKQLNSTKAGIELSLDDPSSFTSAIQQFIDMTDTEWQTYRKGALTLAQSHFNESTDEMLYFQLFNHKEN